LTEMKFWGITRTAEENADDPGEPLKVRLGLRSCPAKL
jgi:hypothetical protein